MKNGIILVVDDNKNVLTALKIFLEQHFERVVLLSSPANLLATVREQRPDVALLDMNFSAGLNTGNEGLFYLGELRKTMPELPVVMMTAYADVELAVEALKEGAADFVTKPWENAKLLATLRAAQALSASRKEVLRLRRKQTALTQSITYEDLCWGKSAAMQQLLSTIEKVAQTDANVLITGENGTGKEVIAKRIHRLSPRRDESWVSVDLGALSESLFESELFGHVKGSFTDAHSDRMGKFEAAIDGTLFLDEIGNLSYALQAKLLSALESRQITRVGSNRPIDVNIRLVCATNRDLYQAVQQGKFREDLLYRINTIQIEAPPLRERKDDIVPLVEFFIKRFAQKYDKHLTLKQSAARKLEEYGWPGNVRELQHAVEEAVILSEGIYLTAENFVLRPITSVSAKADDSLMTIEEMERSLINKAIARHSGNISAMAEELGITRQTLYNKMKKFGI